jgi:hypothetical protein
MTDGSLIVTDDRYPGWRARLVVDEDFGQPWGDALAPALLIEHRRHAVLASEVYRPKDADRIMAAWRHLGGGATFERHLRLVYGTTAISHVTGQDFTVIIFDTGEHRAHAGITGDCDLTGEVHEWRAWLDGDVYGVIVEQHTATGCWIGHDSLWGLYGYDYASSEAATMLAATAGVPPA